MGFVHADLMSDADEIGFELMSDFLRRHQIKHIELEFLSDWYHQGERRRFSDKIRMNY